MGPRQKQIYDLSRMDGLLERMGNPHLAAKTLHIAGTQGTGGVSYLFGRTRRAVGRRRTRGKTETLLGPRSVRCRISSLRIRLCFSSSSTGSCGVTMNLSGRSRCTLDIALLTSPARRASP